MQRNILVLSVLVGAVLAAGCSSHKPRPSATNTSASGTGQTDQSQTSGANNSSAFGAAGAGSGAGTEAAGPTGEQLKIRTVYFEFDSSEIKSEYNDMITAHARYLAANPSMRIRVEGNTDERGSREYNIGLGERRAQAVRRALMLQGVTEAQITTVSYGEERPAVTGHTEEAWSRNRRANIVYLN
jgi:peptidoglycan-associated lipoprotein